MNIRIICRKENYDKYKTMLEKSGFTVSSDSNLTFREDDYIQETFLGLYNNNFEIIHYRNILYVESFGHEITLQTMQKQYLIKEKLYEVAGTLKNKGFIRINKSTVINKLGIKEIRPALNSKLILIMKNDLKLTVNRIYNQAFKQFIGF